MDSLTFMPLTTELNRLFPGINTILDHLEQKPGSKPYILIPQRDGDDSSWRFTTVIKFRNDQRVTESFTSISRSESLFSFRIDFIRNMIREILRPEIDSSSYQTRQLLRHYSGSKVESIRFIDGVHEKDESDHIGDFGRVKELVSYIDEGKYRTDVIFTVWILTVQEGRTIFREQDVVFDLIQYVTNATKSMRIHLLLYLDTMATKFGNHMIDFHFSTTLISTLSFMTPAGLLDDRLDRTICDDYFFHVLVNGSIFQYNYTLLLFEGIMGFIRLDLLRGNEIYYFGEIENCHYDEDTHTYLRDVDLDESSAELPDDVDTTELMDSNLSWAMQLLESMRGK
jgi:hypothetical protein